MEKLTLKIKLMLLWLWIPIAMTAACVLSVLLTGGLEEEMALTQSMGILATVWAALICLVPLIIAFLSLTLKDRANRNTNRVLSIIYAAILLSRLIDILISGPAIFEILFMGSTVVAAVYLIFYSWKWQVK